MEMLRDGLCTESVDLRVMGLPLGRRLALVRTAGGELVLFSPLPVASGYAERVNKLGEVRAIVVPNLFHDRFFPEAFAQFPQAERLANAACCSHYQSWKLREFGEISWLSEEFEWETLGGCP